MSSIPANELKIRGVSVIEQALKGSSEAIVSVRGKDKYVVMKIDHYSYLSHPASLRPLFMRHERIWRRGAL